MVLMSERCSQKQRKTSEINILRKRNKFWETLGNPAVWTSYGPLCAFPPFRFETSESGRLGSTRAASAERWGVGDRQCSPQSKFLLCSHFGFHPPARERNLNGIHHFVF